MSEPIVDQASFNRAVTSALRHLYLASLSGLGEDHEKMAQYDHDATFRATLAQLDEYAYRDTMPSPPMTPPPAPAPTDPRSA